MGAGGYKAAGGGVVAARDPFHCRGETGAASAWRGLRLARLRCAWALTNRRLRPRARNLVLPKAHRTLSQARRVPSAGGRGRIRAVLVASAEKRLAAGHIRRTLLVLCYTPLPVPLPA